VTPRASVRLLPALLLTSVSVWAQSPSTPGDAVKTDGINEERILGVLPNYATVNHPTPATAPLTAKQKWTLFVKETLDPFNVANAAVGAGFSQIGNQTPKYGEGAAPFSMRFGAALGDLATQNLFSAGVLACLLHQDPRYFRMGSERRVLRRVAYSVSRIVVARQDSGAAAFNASGIFGMALGIGASNLYYPSASVRGSVMVARLNTSLTGSLIGNLTSEFWPDLQAILHHSKYFRRI
jgi:hypothetical protein